MLTRPRLRSGNASMIKTTGSFLGTVIMRPTGRTVLGAISSARHSMGRQKTQSTTDSGSLNAFGRNEIEVVPISSALLRIACLVILNKTGRVSDQELAADRVSSSNFTVCLFAFENRSGIAAGKAKHATLSKRVGALESEVAVVEAQCLNPHNMGGTEFDKICEVIR